MNISIDFNKISEETGIRKGHIFYSSAFNSWVVSGHKDINLICIEAPYKSGDTVKDKTVASVKIKNNYWKIELK